MFPPAAMSIWMGQVWSSSTTWSSSPCTVMVWFDVQLLDVNLTDGGLTLHSVGRRLLTLMITSAVGCDESTMLKVVEEPFSLVSPRGGLTSTPALSSSLLVMVTSSLASNPLYPGSLLIAARICTLYVWLPSATSSFRPV